MMLIVWNKQPVEVKDYDILMGAFLKPSDDEIVKVTTSVRTKDQESTALVVDGVDYTKDEIKLWVSGGTTGCSYVVEVTVTTMLGRVDQSEITFIVKEI